MRHDVAHEWRGVRPNHTQEQIRAVISRAWNRAIGGARGGIVQRSRQAGKTVLSLHLLLVREHVQAFIAEAPAKLQLVAPMDPREILIEGDHASDVLALVVGISVAHAESGVAEIRQPGFMKWVGHPQAVGVVDGIGADVGEPVLVRAGGQCFAEKCR